MSETPLWMPLHVADYIADTRHLSALEHGAYFLLLMHAWMQGGGLPTEDARLARIASMTPREWRSARDTVLAFFTLEEGEYRHKRVDEELSRAGGLIEQRRAAGRASAAARASQRDQQRKSNGRSLPVATKRQRKSNQPQPQGSDNKLSGETPVDFQKRAFDLGVEVLGLKGTAAPQARSLVGKWRKVVGDERVGDLLEEARGKADPVEWVAAAVNNRGADDDALGRAIDLKYANLPPVEMPH